MGVACNVRLTFGFSYELAVCQTCARQSGQNVSYVYVLEISWEGMYICTGIFKGNFPSGRKMKKKRSIWGEGGGGGGGGGGQATTPLVVNTTSSQL